MSTKSLTAPLALIKVGTEIIGKMKNIRVTETIRRGRVSGIGQLTPQELPPLEWNGTLNCQSFMISFEKSGIPGSLIRKVDNLEQLINTVLLEEDGVDVVIYKKISKTVDPNTGIVTVIGEEEIASISGCFSDREGFDITEGQISGKDQDFTYMNPILFKS